MKRNKFIWVSSIVTTILSTGATIFGYAVTNQLMYIKKKDVDFVYDRELKAQRFDQNWFNQCPKEELSIDSPNGYPIKGIFLKPLKTQNTIIICHGVTENKISMVKYARMFERLGFNTFVFDHRRHGDSGGKTTSYGYYEKFDVAAVVQTVKSIVGDNALIGIQGESMGAASMILYAGLIEDGADFYIADCGFSNFSELISQIMKKTRYLRTKIPIHLANIFLRIRDGYTFKSVTPKEAVKNIASPVLFIHSMGDDFILPYMTEELYEEKEGPKMIKLFEKGGHAESFNENPEEYEKTVSEFIEKYVYKKTSETVVTPLHGNISATNEIPLDVQETAPKTLPLDEKEIS
ncbi:alpha/beta hydrolase [Ureibacillus aquaedulcis]|uniref:Alpha/beta hydrolase n=1 Tax=Ureibacillus aquaedulcis TaxID=3058421 RepID=A0ABT8GR85_9BACL|nr:alpha/beta hydrolase [Ureibacillus sp. BA0131]MDN4493932.1 alpha/beta hydrolase [Ureibacillus sp. BA0131]